MVQSATDNKFSNLATAIVKSPISSDVNRPDANSYKSASQRKGVLYFAIHHTQKTHIDFILQLDNLGLRQVSQPLKLLRMQQRRRSLLEHTRVRMIHKLLAHVLEQLFKRLELPELIVLVQLDVLHETQDLCRGLGLGAEAVDELGEFTHQTRGDVDFGVQVGLVVAL